MPLSSVPYVYAFCFCDGLSSWSRLITLLFRPANMLITYVSSRGRERIVLRVRCHTFSMPEIDAAARFSFDFAGPFHQFLDIL